MEKKYEMIDNSVKFNGRKVYQIRALRDFGDVKAGDFGGYIEEEENLSHDGLCWIEEESVVYKTAYVAQNARIGKNVVLTNGALVLDNSVVEDGAKIEWSAAIKDNSTIRKGVLIAERFIISKNADIRSGQDLFKLSNLPKVPFVPGKARECTTLFFCRQADESIYLESEFFKGSLEGFKFFLNDRYGDSDFEKLYKSAINLVEAKFAYANGK